MYPLTKTTTSFGITKRREASARKKLSRLSMDNLEETANNKKMFFPDFLCVELIIKKLNSMRKKYVKY